MQSGRIKKLRFSAVSQARGREAEQKAEGLHTILVVGEVSKWQALGRLLPKDPGIFFVEFQDLDRNVLALREPLTVLSPVLCASFDCLDLAMRLDDLGFRGRYRAMSAQLPDPWLIRREIGETCPDLDFDIVDLVNATGRRLN